jgi:hypothetical protein
MSSFKCLSHLHQSLLILLLFLTSGIISSCQKNPSRPATARPASSQKHSAAEQVADPPLPTQASILRGHSAAEQVAFITSIAGAYPEEFTDFIFKPENRYYLEQGTAFDKCSQRLSVIAGLVSGSGRSSDIWRDIENQYARAGIIDSEEVPWRAGNLQADQSIVALGATGGLVQYALELGPDRFRKSAAYQLLKTSTALRAAIFSDQSPSEVAAITALAVQQQTNLLASFASSYCVMIPAQPDPIPKGCGSELEITEISDHQLTLDDGSVWQLQVPDDYDGPEWEAGERVRICHGFLFHANSLTILQATRVQL